MPLALINNHAKDISKLHSEKELNDYQQIELFNTLEKLVDSMGMAERIKNTVFPITYRMFLHICIYIFLGLLSLSLVAIGEIWQVLSVTLISVPFFLLEQVALLIQDPYENRPTDTSITAIARTIEINLRQLIGNEEVPPPLAPEGHYLL